MIQRVGNAHVYYQSIDEEKVAVVQALCNGLMAFPQLRLGQLINNVRETDEDLKDHSDEFHIRDDALAAAINRFVEKHTTKEVSDA